VFELKAVRKYYPSPKGRVAIFSDFNFLLPSGRSLGLLGKNGAGKSTLLRLLSGAELPDTGRVVRHGRISWPVGIIGGLQAGVSGRDNVRFVCRIQGYSGHELVRKTEFVREYSELDDYFDMPVSTYSTGMRSRLSFSLSLAFDFDCYLFDEIMAVGDAGFRKKAAATLTEHKRRSSFVIASHNLHDIRDHSDSVLVLQRGLPPQHFEDVQTGINFYRSTYTSEPA
jgi:capsular polysaccharide transport system ATP-binding protein